MFIDATKMSEENVQEHRYALSKQAPPAIEVTVVIKAPPGDDWNCNSSDDENGLTCSRSFRSLSDQGIDKDGTSSIYSSQDGSSSDCESERLDYATDVDEGFDLGRAFVEPVIDKHPSALVTFECKRSTTPLAVKVRSWHYILQQADLVLQQWEKSARRPSRWVCCCLFADCRFDSCL